MALKLDGILEIIKSKNGDEICAVGEVIIDVSKYSLREIRTFISKVKPFRNVYIGEATGEFGYVHSLNFDDPFIITLKNISNLEKDDLLELCQTKNRNVKIRFDLCS
jgi:hypothetical protein